MRKSRLRRADRGALLRCAVVDDETCKRLDHTGCVRCEIFMLTKPFLQLWACYGHLHSQLQVARRSAAQSFQHILPGVSRSILTSLESARVDRPGVLGASGGSECQRTV
eukprot:6343235-Amphidinium_carterae.2